MDWVEHLRWVSHFIITHVFYILCLEGWNSWNHFHRNISETIIQQTADTIVATGLAAAGYQYGLFLCNSYLSNYLPFCIFSTVNLDDCWQVSRDAQGIIQADPKAFPSGIPALADYVHSRKLKFGLYSGTIIILVSFYSLHS
jgi:alpha-galactosidase